MARLDIRVDGRTCYSRTVDDAVVARVLAATEEGKRAFGGTVVKRPKHPAKRSAPEKASNESGKADAPETTVAHGEVAQA